MTKQNRIDRNVLVVGFGRTQAVLGVLAGVLFFATVPILVAGQSTLVEHIIAPQQTDAAIDQDLDNHYAWLDPSAATNHQLFVYLPGTGGVPANALLIQQIAAQLGYHAIGLMYVDDFAIQVLCVTATDPSACSYNARLENQTGADVSSDIVVNQANSIDNRLTKLLQYLALQYPSEGWDQFLVGDAPDWSQIAVGGTSQGGGQSAFIGKIRRVAGVLMFSAPVEHYGGQPPTWESTDHLTPTDRYFGFAHDQDTAYPPILAGWTALGMNRPNFGPLVQVELSAPPYQGSHMLFTDLKPKEGPDYKYAHPSTVIDAYTPRDQGKPVFADVWIYMLNGN